MGSNKQELEKLKDNYGIYKGFRNEGLLIVRLIGVMINWDLK